MNRLRELRERRGLTQEQLATKAGVSVRAIKYHEAGEHAPSLRNLKALAGALKVPVEKLI